jgi:hypothetical protein
MSLSLNIKSWLSFRSIPRKREPAPPRRWHCKIRRTRRGRDLPITDIVGYSRTKSPSGQHPSHIYIMSTTSANPQSESKSPRSVLHARAPAPEFTLRCTPDQSVSLSELPTWRALLPELVEKEDLEAASALNGIEFNLARPPTGWCFRTSIPLRLAARNSKPI